MLIIYPVWGYADTLILNNDVRYEGDFIEETKDGVWFDLPKTGRIFFKHGEVRALISQGRHEHKGKRSLIRKIKDGFKRLLQKL